MPLFFSGLVDLQNFLSFIFHTLGNVLDCGLVIENDFKHLAHIHFFDCQLGPAKRIGTDLAPDIDGLVNFDFVGHEAPPVVSSESKVRSSEKKPVFTPNSKLRTPDYPAFPSSTLITIVCPATQSILLISSSALRTSRSTASWLIMTSGTASAAPRPFWITDEMLMLFFPSTPEIL